MKTLKPFIKWVGGKRWFVRGYSHFLPSKYNCYIEPFLGGGSVYFTLAPQKAILGDANRDLINTYSALKENWQLVYQYLRVHHRKHSKDYYYLIRGKKLRSSFSKAAQFIYLNRTCYNGLYRVNRQGQFNVPIGTRSSVLFKDDSFEIISKLLQSATLIVADFEDLINVASEGDFVFFDPPYKIRHNIDGFVSYNEKLFSWDDQVRLFHAVRRAKDRGVVILGTNVCHQSLCELYAPDFHMIEVNRNSSISSKVEYRGCFRELVISSEKWSG